MDQTSGMLDRKLIFYGLLSVFVFVLLSQININFGTFLAADVLLGVALGFASQTAVSNIIRGLFLFIERPFQVSDVIRVDGQFGLVESIDLLSVKIKRSTTSTGGYPTKNCYKVLSTRSRSSRFDAGI